MPVSETEEALGGIIGLAAGGAMLLLLSRNLDAQIGVNLTFWGVAFILVAMLLGVLLVISVVRAILEGL